MKLKVKIAIVMDSRESNIMVATLETTPHRSPEQDKMLGDLRIMTEQAREIHSCMERV